MSSIKALPVASRLGLLLAYDLRFVLRWPLATMAGSLLILVATAALYLIIPMGFLPSEDNAQVFSFTEAAEGISFNGMVEHQRALNAIVRQDPNVEAFFSSVGSRGGINSSNQGVIFMHLVPRAKRTLSVDGVI